MSHFYASIQGNRQAATKQGTKQSGIQGHVRGWSIGGRVNCFHDEATGRDLVLVTITGGSNNDSIKLDLGCYEVNEKGEYVKVK